LFFCIFTQFTIYFWPLALHNDTGKKGEQLAVEFLQKAGYAVIERNFRWKRFEIDIIAQLGKFLVFVEVKTKTNTSYGTPDTNVTPRKAAQVMEAAEEYIFENNWTGEIRFDIISVIIQPKHTEIEHIRDAFY
jgi:putative endonuclease